MTQRYNVSFSFKISKGEYYGEIVSVSASEFVPEGKDPVEYLRERIGAEIKRTTKDIEFETEDKV